MTSTEKVRYEVSYGPKDESHREVKKFSDRDKAVRIFKELDKAGFHVDAYEVKTVVTHTKLSV